jgi:hypothetical protein
MTAEDKSPAAEGVPQLKKALKTAAKLAFKPFELYPALKAAAIAILVALVALLGWAALCEWTFVAPLVEIFVFTILGITALVFFKEMILGRILKYRNSYLDVSIAVIMCLFGWLIFYPYLYLIDPLYIKWGRTK